MYLYTSISNTFVLLNFSFVGQYLIVRASRDIDQSEGIFNCYGTLFKNISCFNCVRNLLM